VQRQNIHKRNTVTAGPIWIRPIAAQEYCDSRRDKRGQEKIASNLFCPSKIYNILPFLYERPFFYFSIPLHLDLRKKSGQYILGVRLWGFSPTLVFVNSFTRIEDKTYAWYECTCMAALLSYVLQGQHVSKEIFACTPPFLVHADSEQFLARLPFYCTHIFLIFCILMAAQCADGAGGWVF